MLWRTVVNLACNDSRAVHILRTSRIFRSRLPTEGWYPGPIASDVHGLSVCLSDVRCLLVTTMNCGKTAGPIEMPFGKWGGVGHSHHVLDGGPDPPTGRGNFGVGKGPSHSKV